MDFYLDTKYNAYLEINTDVAEKKSIQDWCFGSRQEKQLSCEIASLNVIFILVF